MPLEEFVSGPISVRTVYVDANVLQPSVMHRPADEIRQIWWGDRLHSWTAKVIAPWRPGAPWLGEQRAALTHIAEQTRAGRVRLVTGPEVRHETWFLKHGRLAWTSASVLAGVIEFVEPPFYLDRIFIAYDDRPGDAASRRDFALSRTDDNRFNELKKATGGNKDADAYHIRCAEHAKAEFFLTTDKKLKNSLVNQKALHLRTTLVFPTELVAVLAA